MIDRRADSTLKLPLASDADEGQFQHGHAEVGNRVGLAAGAHWAGAAFHDAAVGARSVRFMGGISECP